MNLFPAVLAAAKVRILFSLSLTSHDLSASPDKITPLKDSRIRASSVAESSYLTHPEHACENIRERLGDTASEASLMLRIEESR